DARIAAIDKELVGEYPEYTALANPEPLTIADTQLELRPDEALVAFVPLQEETFIWVMTKTDVRWERIELGTKALAERMLALRCGLDEVVWKEGSTSKDRCLELVKLQPYDGVGFTGALPFDLERAHELYKALFGQVEDLIKDKHLLVVPSGPLTSL